LATILKANALANTARPESSPFLTQELEMGFASPLGELPPRNPAGTLFQCVAECETVRVWKGATHLAAWNKIPLNPTFSVEYKFGGWSEFVPS